MLKKNDQCLNTHIKRDVSILIFIAGAVLQTCWSSVIHIETQNIKALLTSTHSVRATAPRAPLGTRIFIILQDIKCVHLKSQTVVMFRKV